jgi:hypothetical protein
MVLFHHRTPGKSLFIPWKNLMALRQEHKPFEECKKDTLYRISLTRSRRLLPLWAPLKRVCAFLSLPAFEAPEWSKNRRDWYR